MSQVIHCNMFATCQHSLEAVIKNGMEAAVTNFNVTFSDASPDGRATVGWVFLGTAEIIITAEATGLREAALSGLDDAQKELDAKHTKAQTELNSRRSNLLAIEYTTLVPDHE